MPSNSPSAPIIAVPPQFGWAGAVKIASSTQIFPIAGVFLLGDDARRQRMPASAGAADHHRIANPRRAGISQRQHRHVEPRQCLHKSKSGVLIVSQHRTLHGAAIVERKPDRFRFRDQVADRQHNAVADENAVAAALGAERFGGEGVAWE